MIEVYAFLAMFAVQVLALSVLYPAQFTRYVRTQAARLPIERLARLYPGVDLSLAQERFLTQYRAASAGLAVLGLMLLGWLSSYMRRPGWDEGPAVILTSVYFVVQVLPLIFITWLGYGFARMHKHSLPEGRRTASLQRRRLFDFISPFMVFLAVSSYFLFVAFVIHIQRQPLPGFALIGALTLVYASNALWVYTMLYGKKKSLFETHAGRLHTISLSVKSAVYGCIACAVFFSFTFTLDLLDLKRWMPFAQSVFLVIVAFQCLMGLTAPPHEPQADELGSNRPS